MTQPPDLPTRICPSCSTQSRTDGNFCPHCGASLVKRKRRFGHRGKIILAASVVLLLAAGGGTAFALKIQHENDAKAKRERQAQIAQEREREAAREAAREARQRRENEERQAALDEIELDGRRALEKDLRRAIVKGAKELVVQGLLDGPILRAECDAVGGGRDDLQAQTGKYECMAVNELNDDGSYRGYSYDATINYDEFSYTWKLGNG